MQLLEVKTFTVLPNPNLASGSLDHWAQWCQMTHRWTTMNDFLSWFKWLTLRIQWHFSTWELRNFDHLCLCVMFSMQKLNDFISLWMRKIWNAVFFKEFPSVQAWCAKSKEHICKLCEFLLLPNQNYGINSNLYQFFYSCRPYST